MKHLSRNDPCWCGSGKKYKKCHLAEDKASNTSSKSSSKAPSHIILKTAAQIQGIRQCGKLVKNTLDMVAERIQAGVTTNQINEWVHEYTLDHGATPAPLNYRGFPKSVCTSINDVICHGVPDDTVLQDGDIINVDVTSILNGYFGDSSRMFCIGNVSKEAKKLVDITQECLQLGMDAVKPGAFLGDIGAAIQAHVAPHGYSIVEDFAGHGTGIYFHEAPQVLHSGRRGSGVQLVPNMVFTIEPMINIGSPQSRVLADKWTAKTIDGSLSAQWEHTICVTESGYSILTG